LFKTKVQLLVDMLTHNDRSNLMWLSQIHPRGTSAEAQPT